MGARVIVAATALCVARQARGQEGAGLTADERAEIEAALAEDAGDAQTGPAEVAARATRAPAAAQSMSPDLSLILDVAGAYYDERDPLQTGAHDPAETGFTLQQLELHLGSSVDPFFRLDANLVFSLFGVELEEAYATTLSLPGRLQLRAGQFLTRFGRLNPTHPHAWSFVDQPLVNGKFFGGEGSRGLGVEISWLAPLPWSVELVWSVNNADGACCARSFYGESSPGVDGLEDLLFTTGLRQFFDLTRDWGLLWGWSAQLGPNGSGHRNRTNLFGTDLTLRFRPVTSTRRSALTLQTEAMARSRQEPGDTLQDLGLYSMLVWDISARWQTGVRYEWVSGVAGDPLDEDWESPRARTSAQVTFAPSHFSRLRLQGKCDDPTWRETPIWGVIAAAEFLIGAHAAHAY